MPIGRPPTANTLWVPGGISATGATTYLCIAPALSFVLTPNPLDGQRGAIAFLSVWAHLTRVKAEPTIWCGNQRIWAPAVEPVGRRWGSSSAPCHRLSAPQAAAWLTRLNQKL